MSQPLFYFVFSLRAFFKKAAERIDTISLLFIYCLFVTMPDINSQARTTSAEIVHTPHAPLTAYYQDEAARENFLREIFDSTAADYDRIEKLLAFGSGPWYRRQALTRAGLTAGMRVADVGVGTGLVAREAVTLVGDASLVTGIDPSPGMMGAANLPAGP